MELDPTRRAAVWIGYATAALTVVTFVVALATPPISGSFCVENCIDYPYLDTLDRFPRDYLWMPLAIVLTLLYLALVASVHELAPMGRQLASRLSPRPRPDRRDRAAHPVQPHGLFIALEEVGYLAIALSFGAVAAAVPGRRPAARAVRWVFGATPVVVIAALVGVMAVRSTDRGYLVEVIVIIIDWLALLVGSVLLARLFRSPPEVSGSPHAG